MRWLDHLVGASAGGPDAPSGPPFSLGRASQRTVCRSCPCLLQAFYDDLLLTYARPAQDPSLHKAVLHDLICS